MLCKDAGGNEVYTHRSLRLQLCWKNFQPNQLQYANSTMVGTYIAGSKVVIQYGSMLLAPLCCTGVDSRLISLDASQKT